MIGWKNVRSYVNSCDRNRLVFASWRFRLRREYDGVVDANILKIVRRLLLWWHVHNSFLVYVAFLFYLSTLDDCLTKSRDDCLTNFNQPITENCDQSKKSVLRILCATWLVHLIGSVLWTKLYFWSHETRTLTIWRLHLLWELFEKKPYTDKLRGSNGIFLRFFELR